MIKAVRSILLLLALAGTFLAGSWYSRRTPVANSPDRARRVLYYVDPMHPAYRSGAPGTAPDCGMPLEPVYADSGSAMRGTVSIGPEKQQLYGVRIGQAETSSEEHTLRLFGRVAPDESRVYRLNSGVDGIVQQTSDVTTGSQVRKDQVLAEFSSPEFLSPMQSHIFTLDTLEQLQRGGGASETQLEINASSVHQSYDRLQSMGMSPLQIEEIARTRKISRTVRIVAPADGFVLTRNVSPGQRFEKGEQWYCIADLKSVWIVADLPGSEADHVVAGARARVTLVDRKKTLTATVGEVLPQFDAATRSLKLRLVADNPGYILRPGMFLDVELPIRLPSAVTVPAGAVLDSGMKKVVFVDRGEGNFEARQVETGWRFGDRVEIVQGLAAGERIVISGNFLLDSETRMKQAAEATAMPARDPNPSFAAKRKPARGPS